MPRKACIFGANLSFLESPTFSGEIVFGWGGYGVLSIHRLMLSLQKLGVHG